MGDEAEEYAFQQERSALGRPIATVRQNLGRESQTTAPLQALLPDTMHQISLFIQPRWRAV